MSLDIKQYANMTDDQILDKLLNADEAPIPEKTVLIKRLGIPITLKGISQKKIAKLRNRYTRTVKGRKGAPDTKEVDSEEFVLALIVESTVKPNFNKEELFNKYKVSGPVELISRIFLPGELEQLSEVAYELCGYEDEFEEIEEIKN